MNSDLINYQTKYDLNDVEQFIGEYNCSKKMRLANILSKLTKFESVWLPSYLELQKALIFERGYQNALTAAPEEQQKFIEFMTPIIDDFYKKSENKDKKQKL